jgi:hypothetical protein
METWLAFSVSQRLRGIIAWRCVLARREAGPVFSTVGIWQNGKLTRSQNQPPSAALATCFLTENSPPLPYISPKDQANCKLST